MNNQNEQLIGLEDYIKERIKALDTHIKLKREELLIAIEKELAPFSAAKAELVLIQEGIENSIKKTQELKQDETATIDIK